MQKVSRCTGEIKMEEELKKSIKVKYDSDSFYKYAMGYYDSGLKLIDILLDDNRYKELSRWNDEFRKESIKLEEECNIYPVMFLFRQYLELMIKALYKEFDILIPKKDFNTHKLSYLWPKLKEKLQEIERENEEQLYGTTEILTDIVNNFSKIDDESYCFRYPISKKGNPYFKKDKTYDLYKIRSDITEFDTLIHEFL